MPIAFLNLRCTTTGNKQPKAVQQKVPIRSFLLANSADAPLRFSDVTDAPEERDSVLNGFRMVEDVVTGFGGGLFLKMLEKVEVDGEGEGGADAAGDEEDLVIG